MSYWNLNFICIDHAHLLHNLKKNNHLTDNDNNSTESYLKEKKNQIENGHQDLQI